MPYAGNGTIINSPLLNGLDKDQAILKIIKHFENKNIGKKSINYKLRDWEFHDKDIEAALYQLFIMRMARTGF